MANKCINSDCPLLAEEGYLYCKRHSEENLGWPPRLRQTVKTLITVR
jgi:hypothetical protein